MLYTFSVPLSSSRTRAGLLKGGPGRVCSANFAMTGFSEDRRISAHERRVDPLKALTPLKHISNARGLKPSL
jgi:hypothetical protein